MRTSLADLGTAAFLTAASVASEGTWLANCTAPMVDRESLETTGVEAFSGSLIDTCGTWSTAVETWLIVFALAESVILPLVVLK